MADNSRGSARAIRTALDVKAAKPGRYSVDGATGLRLLVRPSGARFWIMRFMRDGKAREAGLGPASYDGRGGKTLAQAREEAAKMRGILQAGIDPIAAREAERATAEAEQAQTFETVARGYVASRKMAWRSEKHAAQWLATLEAHAFPVIGDVPIAAVDTEAVLRVLRPVWTATPETASRLRGRIENVLDSAQAAGWRDRNAANPARWKGHLAALLPPPRKVRPVRHQPALDPAAMPDFMAALREREGVSALALRFAVLTAARSGEVRGATWTEIDLDAKVWTISARRMKAGRLHRVALSDAALDVLREAAELRTSKRPDAVVFPAPRRGGPLSDMSLSMMLRGMCCDGLAEGEPPRWRDAEGRAVVVHGFRASFKAWSLAAGWPDHLSEAALAHSDKDKVRAAYARSDLVEQRRPLMAAWADFCEGKAAVVVDLAAKRRRKAAEA